MLVIFGIDLSQEDGFERLKEYIELAEGGSVISEILKEISEEINHARIRGMVRNKLVLENVLELVHNYAVSRDL